MLRYFDIFELWDILTFKPPLPRCEAAVAASQSYLLSTPGWIFKIHTHPCFTIDFKSYDCVAPHWLYNSRSHSRRRILLSMYCIEMSKYLQFCRFSKYWVFFGPSLLRFRGVWDPCDQNDIHLIMRLKSKRRKILRWTLLTEHLTILLNPEENWIELIVRTLNKGRWKVVRDVGKEG